MDLATVLNNRLFERVSARLADDIALQVRVGQVSGEFLIKLTLEIYTTYCDYFKQNGGSVLQGLDPLKPEEIRQISLDAIKKFLVKLNDSLTTPFFIDACSIDQQEKNMPTYSSMLLSLMIYSHAIQEKRYSFTPESPTVDDLERAKTQDSLTPKSRKRMIAIFKKE